MRYNGLVINSKKVVNFISDKHDIIKHLFNVGFIFTEADISIAIAKSSKTMSNDTILTTSFITDQLLKLSIISPIGDEIGNYQIHGDFRHFLESLFDEYAKVSDDEFNHMVNLIDSQRKRLSDVIRIRENNVDCDLFDILNELIRSFGELETLFFRNYQALCKETSKLKQSEDLKSVKLKKINYLWDNYLNAAVDILMPNSLFCNIHNELLSLSDTIKELDVFSPEKKRSPYHIRLMNSFRIKINSSLSCMHVQHDKMSSLMFPLKEEYRMTDAGVGASLFLQNLTNDLEAGPVLDFFESSFSSKVNVSMPLKWANEEDVFSYMLRVKEYEHISSEVDYTAFHKQQKNSDLVPKYSLPSVSFVCDNIIKSFKGKALPKDILRYLYFIYGEKYTSKDFFAIYSSFFYNNEVFDLIHGELSGVTLNTRSNTLKYYPVGIRRK